MPTKSAWMISAPSSSSWARWRATLSRAAAQARIAVSSPAAIGIAVAGAAGVAASMVLVPGLDGIAGAGLAAVMVAIAAVDMRRFIIPDELTIAALLLGLLDAALVDADMMAAALAAVVRGVVAAGAFLALRAAYRYLRGRQGLGLGDVKLAAVAGVWLDWPMIPVAIEIAAVAALVTYLVRHLVLRRRVGPATRLPLGLFLAPAIWVGWILQARIATMSLLWF